MRRFAWLLQPPRWLILIGALIGAGVFIAVSVMATPFFSRDEPGYLMFPPVLFAAALSLLLPAARGFGIGLFASVLITSVTGSLDGRMWLESIGGMAKYATRSIRARETRKAHMAGWLNAHRRRPLEVRGALTLLSNLRGECLRPLTSDENGLGVPEDLDGLLNYPNCEPYGVTTMRVRAEWPKRYVEDDEGWRWTFARLPGTVAGRPNFRLELRPDAVLDQAGPVVEEVADGRVRVRDRDGAPWRMVATPIPTMRRVRECVLLAAAKAAEERDTTAMFEYMWEGYYANHVCREIRMSSATARENGDHVVDIKPFVRFDEPRPEDHSVLFRMVGERRFEIRSSAWYRSYLLDADGVLHVATRRNAEVSDPAPEQCEELTSVSCGK